MTTYTKAQLRNRVLQKLGILGSGETATADDAALVEQVIDNLHAQLDREIYLSWTTATVPDTVFEPLAVLVAAGCRDEFLLPADRRQELALMAAAALGEIRTQVAADTRPTVVPATYY